MSDRFSQPVIFGGAFSTACLGLLYFRSETIYEIPEEVSGLMGKTPLGGVIQNVRDAQWRYFLFGGVEPCPCMWEIRPRKILPAVRNSLRTHHFRAIREREKIAKPPNNRNVIMLSQLWHSLVHLLHANPDLNPMIFCGVDAHHFC